MKHFIRLFGVNPTHVTTERESAGHGSVINRVISYRGSLGTRLSRNVWQSSSLPNPGTAGCITRCRHVCCCAHDNSSKAGRDTKHDSMHSASGRASFPQLDHRDRTRSVNSPSCSEAASLLHLEFVSSHMAPATSPPLRTIGLHSIKDIVPNNEVYFRGPK